MARATLTFFVRTSSIVRRWRRHARRGRRRQQLFAVAVGKYRLDLGHILGHDAVYRLQLAEGERYVPIADWTQPLRPCQRRRADILQDRLSAAQLRQDVDPQRRIIPVLGIKLRVNIVPPLAQQTGDQFEAVPQARDAVRHQERSHQVHGDAKVFGPAQQIGAHLQYGGPVRWLRLGDGVADYMLGSALGSPLERAEVGVVLEVAAAGRAI